MDGFTGESTQKGGGVKKKNNRNERERLELFEFDRVNIQGKRWYVVQDGPGRTGSRYVTPLEAGGVDGECTTGTPIR
jgi:hypothetical protein